LLFRRLFRHDGLIILDKKVLPMFRGLFRSALPAALALVIVAISPSHASAEDAKCTPKNGLFSKYFHVRSQSPVPDTVFFDNGETPKKASDYRNRGMVVNFWATWCAPCVREMPSLDSLKAQLSDSQIDVLALSEDRAGAWIVKKFYKVNHINSLDVLIDKRSKVFHAMDITELPTTLLIDFEGREVGRITGPAEWDSPEIKDFLQACLSPAEPGKALHAPG
jgi:thiol-disulfide isomerase/thioredoxin